MSSGVGVVAVVWCFATLVSIGFAWGLKRLLTDLDVGGTLRSALFATIACLTLSSLVGAALLYPCYLVLRMVARPSADDPEYFWAFELIVLPPVLLIPPTIVFFWLSVPMVIQSLKRQ
ncbi:MAG: hypothetical protein AAFR41_01680 [Pseudomonadota bacterium]